MAFPDAIADATALKIGRAFVYRAFEGAGGAIQNGPPFGFSIPLVFPRMRSKSWGFHPLLVG
jgi:hypothetical protein